MDKNPALLQPAFSALGRALAGRDYPPVRPFERRWPRLWQYGVPVGLLVLVLLYAGTVAYFVDSRKLPMSTALLLALLTLAPLPLLFRWPLAAWRLSMLGLLFGTFNRSESGLPWSPTQILVSLVVLAVVATRADRAVLAWVGVLSLVPAWIFMAESDLLFTIVLVTLILLIGDQVRRLRHTRRALAEQTEVSEHEQARRTVLEERARIARELHDVVAHHMSLIAVRAETAPYRLGGLPDAARDEFTAVASAAREALTEMRRLLGTLRNDSSAPELAPQPDLAAVDELVRTARQAGLAVHYLPPEPDTMRRPPEPVSLAGFRIVQEALANATRHAPGAPVSVQVWPGTRELSVRVHNDAPPDPVGPPREPEGEGHGLAGMRERATLLGGEFSAAASGDGGFTVTATLPYDGAGT
jgi:signal transduction histidine kinase